MDSFNSSISQGTIKTCSPTEKNEGVGNATSNQRSCTRYRKSTELGGVHEAPH